jgi:DinB superfamily
VEVSVKLVTTLGLLVAIGSARVAAQEFKASDNPVSDTVRQILTRESKNLVGSASLMPAEKYGFQPTPAQMTFGQLVVHVVQTNTALCSAIDGTPTSGDRYPQLLMALTGKLSEKDSKETLVGAITQSFDYCSDVMRRATDAHLGDQVSMFGRATGQSRAAVMVTIATDWTDHYSTAASYLRLNGILPPSAKPQPAQ